MIGSLKRLVIGLAIISAGLGTTALLTPATAYADHQTGHACNSGFLTFPAWYDGLLDPATCRIAEPSSGTNGNGLSKFIFAIVLNVIEILLQLIGYVAVGFIIYGGFKYLTSAGSADRITAGRKVITNALVGLVISFMSVAIVNLVATNINTTAGDGCAAATGGRIDPDCVGIAKVGAQQSINGILNTVYYAAGAIAVIVIIVSSIFYVISQGDASRIKRAKDGILYAVVGLVVILLAFVITNFVIGRF